LLPLRGLARRAEPFAHGSILRKGTKKLCAEGMRDDDLKHNLEGKTGRSGERGKDAAGDAAGKSAGNFETPWAISRQMGGEGANIINKGGGWAHSNRK